MRRPSGGLELRHAVALGVLHGPTELLPISSSAHTTLVPWLLGWPYAELDPELRKAFEVALHAGTAAALLVGLRDEVAAAARGLDHRRAVLILGSFVPPAIVGYTLERPIERRLGTPPTIAAGLAAGAAAMWLADARAPQRRERTDAGVADALALGFAQACALVPGVSRSGSTITAGLFLGLDRESAARYSFLLSVPAVVLSGLFEARKIGEPGGADLVPTLIATVLAFIVGYASIAWMLRWLTSHTTVVFVIYRVALGSLVIVLTAAGAIS
jgi:undecaprenyl-diphosphatase